MQIGNEEVSAGTSPDGLGSPGTQLATEAFKHVLWVKKGANLRRVFKYVIRKRLSVSTSTMATTLSLLDAVLETPWCTLVVCAVAPHSSFGYTRELY